MVAIDVQSAEETQVFRGELTKLKEEAYPGSPEYPNLNFTDRKLAKIKSSTVADHIDHAREGMRAVHQE